VQEDAVGVNAANVNLCRALGIDTKEVTRVVIFIDHGKQPTAMVTKNIITSLGVVEAVEKLHLEARKP
jgi:hypothetical protein